MPSSWMLRRVVLVRINVSKGRSASIIRVTRIGELLFLCRVRRLLVNANVVPGFVPSSPIVVTLIMEALRSSETSVLHSHRMYIY
jgi:hypothetical protein